MKRRPTLSLAGLCTALMVALLSLAGAHLVLAQAPTDPALQGRLLRRSDGALYVYRDGARYPVVPAQLSDDQINTIPEAGLLVERLSDLFALNAPVENSTMTTTGPLSVGPAAPTGSAAPVGSALAALVGRATPLCGFRGEPLSVTVERADLMTGMDGLPRALLLVEIANLGQRTAQVTAPVQLRDDRGRLFDQSSAGLNPDLTTLARQLGIPSPAPQELPPGLTRRQLWAFTVPTDAQGLTLVPNPLAPCGSGQAPVTTGS